MSPAFPIDNGPPIDVAGSNRLSVSRAARAGVARLLHIAFDAMTRRQARIRAATPPDDCARHAPLDARYGADYSLIHAFSAYITSGSGEGRIEAHYAAHFGDDTRHFADTLALIIAASRFYYYAGPRFSRCFDNLSIS